MKTDLEFLNHQVFILTDYYKVINLPAFSAYDKIELDLGCGKGLFTLELAKQSPKTLFLAADIKLGRLRKLVNKANLQRIKNILAFRTLALPLISFLLPDNLLDAVHIICPDPWPKFRHRKYKLLTSQFFAFLACKMKVGAYLHLASDDKIYIDWIKRNLLANKNFSSQYEDARHYAQIESEFKKLWIKLGKTIEHWGYYRI